MNDSSWFKIYRKMLNWEWFHDSKTLHVFLYLLIRANVKDSRFGKQLVRRGQLVTSYQSIAEATGKSVSSVRRAIDNLVSTGEISVIVTNRYSLITIENFEKYQNVRVNFEQSEEQSAEHSKEQSTEQHNKNIKKNKEKKEEIQDGTIHDDQSAVTAKRSYTKKRRKSGEGYVPQYFEYKLDIPKKYFGLFASEDEWWDYVEKHREEVKEAYELSV